MNINTRSINILVSFVQEVLSTIDFQLSISFMDLGWFEIMESREIEIKGLLLWNSNITYICINSRNKKIRKRQ